MFKYGKRIRFWIIFFFIVRLYGITNPPLEASTTWRQCDVLMIARNFYEAEANIMYPKVDVAGSRTGIVGSEFPAYNYSIFIIAEIFGYDHWYGRIINLVLGSIATFYFFLMIREYFGEPSAFYATMMFLCSLAFALFRTTLPDPFALSLCLIALYSGLRYLRGGNFLLLAIYFLLAMLGCLSKVSAATVLTVLIIPFFDGSILVKRKVVFSFVSFFVLIPVVGWYFYWVPLLNTTYQFGGHFFMGMDFFKGLGQLFHHWPKVLKQFYEAPMKYSGFITFIVAIFICFKFRQRVAIVTFAIPFLAYLFIIVKTGEMFTVNPHYPFMFIPSMAFITGVGLSQIKKAQCVYIILCIVAVENIANQAHLFRTPKARLVLTHLEDILNSHNVKQDDLIAINAFHPHHATPMYFAHRKGWNIPSEELLKSGQIEALRREGCKYIVILKDRFGEDVNLDIQQVFESDDFAIYKL